MTAHTCNKPSAFFKSDDQKSVLMRKRAEIYYGGERKIAKAFSCLQLSVECIPRVVRMDVTNVDLTSLSHIQIENAYRDASLSVMEHHQRQIQAFRLTATKTLLEEVNQRMHDTRHALVQNRDRITKLVQQMRTCDDEYESLGRKVTLTMSEMISHFNTAADALVRRYQDRINILEDQYSRETSDLEVNFSRKRRFLETLISLVEIDVARQVEDIQTEHRHELECHREEASAKELRMRTHILERISALKSIEEQLVMEFKETTELASATRKSLLSQDRKHSTSLEADQRIVSQLSLEISHLRGRIDSVESAPLALLKAEKDRLLNCLRKFKDKIQAQNGYHGQRLGRLASLFDRSKKKIEAELLLVNQIERAWSQCARLGLNPSADIEEDPLRSLEKTFAEILVNNAQLESEIVKLERDNNRVD